MKHTDLTDRDPGGVIDHADRSITVDKLAEDIDASMIGFDATWVHGVRFVSGLIVSGYTLEAGETKVIPPDLSPTRTYIIAIKVDGPAGIPSGGMLIAGLYWRANNKPRLFLKNIGTQQLQGCGAWLAHVEFKD